MANRTNNNLVSKVWQQGIFDKKVVFCTGGSGDICSAQVRALVYLGANACIIGRNKEKAERVAEDISTVREGARVLGYGSVDVRNIKDLEAAASKCAQELGGIDFVIAGAAGNFLAPFMQLSTNAFKTVLEIDLVGSWNAAKATVPYLLESASRNDGGGRILFISATTQYTGAQLNTHAVVAKSGIDALSAQLAIELGPRGICSNVVAPGPIDDTEGVRRLKVSDKNSAARIPLGSNGTKKNIADSTAFLFSDAADYINGTVLVVDGGSWRTGGGQIGANFPYPDFLLSGEKVSSMGSTSTKL